jgi:hypothetical protein
MGYQTRTTADAAAIASEKRSIDRWRSGCFPEEPSSGDGFHTVRSPT